MHESSYFTCIMASRSHTLYVGVTGDLFKRVFQHKWKEDDGFTARYNCDRLVWFERYDDVNRAIAREKKISRDGDARESLRSFESVNRIWADLSHDWYECEPADYRRALDRIET